ncbi:MAG: trans-sulfuration enzyme family protein [Candidatus Aminicenantia bacterium]
MKEGILAKLRKDTICVHGSGRRDPMARAVSFPIYQSSTFAFESTEQALEVFEERKLGYIYTRWGNPTIEYLEEMMTLLEGGQDALITASGMAALSTLVLTLVKKSENIIAQTVLYGGSYSFFKHFVERFGIEARFANRPVHEYIENLIDEKTKLIYIETPANPTLMIVDIAECAKIAKKYGIPLAVDNTFATPYLQNPISLGADIVLHSATKYINGHADVVGGILVGSKEFIEKAKKEVLREIGGVMDPFGAWLMIRGLKTLAVRMEKHCKNARALADFLSKHEKIEKVYYPGLPEHEGHEIAKKQMRDFGGMLSFELKGGREAGERLMNNLKVMILAVSLGDVGTLITHPASSTHRQYSKEELSAFGLSEGLVRISVGIEDTDDLIEDISQALGKI